MRDVRKYKCSYAPFFCFSLFFFGGGEGRLGRERVISTIFYKGGLIWILISFNTTDDDDDADGMKIRIKYVRVSITA